MREFIHSDDLASAIFLSLNVKKDTFKKQFHDKLPIMNVGTKDVISIKKLSTLIAKYIDFKGKIILPKSARIVLSIMQRIRNRDLLENIANQEFIYDDKNSLDLLVNTEAAIAITPLSLSQKYLKIDSRLSIFFPDDGVPLLWNFAMIKSSLNILLFLSKS